MTTRYALKSFACILDIPSLQNAVDLDDDLLPPKCNHDVHLLWWINHGQGMIKNISSVATNFVSVELFSDENRQVFKSIPSHIVNSLVQWFQRKHFHCKIVLSQQSCHLWPCHDKAFFYQGHNWQPQKWWNFHYIQSFIKPNETTYNWKNTHIQHSLMPRL